MAMNMEYCQFRNTLAALKELDFSKEHHKTLSWEEVKAKKQLVELILEIGEPYLEEEEWNDQ